MYIALIILFVFLVYCVITYNSLISKKNGANNAGAGIDVMLKRRFDLIPNLVSTAKAYMKHEETVLNELTVLRTQASVPNLTHEQKVDLDKQMTQALSHFKISVEAYPDLKASEQFVMLQRSINEVEEQISAARRTFNAAVTELNNAIEMFPSNIFAGMMNLTTRPLFDIPAEERVNPNVASLFSQE